MSIVVRTLSDQAYEIIRERILSNQIEASKPIRQDAISKGLGVSKIPLREALARLEHDGLLISHPNRGFLVKPLSVVEAEDVFQLRMAVEPDAVAGACKLASEEQRQKVKGIFEELQALSDQLSSKAISLNSQFHLSISESPDKLITLAILDKLHLHSERYVRKHLEPTNRETAAFQEHQHIFEAWMERDVKRVKKLTIKHIKTTLVEVREQLQLEERVQ